MAECRNEGSKLLNVTVWASKQLEIMSDMLRESPAVSRAWFAAEANRVRPALDEAGREYLKAIEGEGT